MLRPLPSTKLIATKSLPIVTWANVVYRICKARHAPGYFGKDGRNRWDAPRGEYGVCYVAESPEGAFVETCVRDDRPRGSRYLSQQFLQERRMMKLSFLRPLSLVDLTGPGLSLLDADGRLTVGSYKICQRWSHAFWRHTDRPDGICYFSRFNSSLRCIALFDRVIADHWTDRGLLSDPENSFFLRDMLNRYHFALL